MVVQEKGKTVRAMDIKLHVGAKSDAVAISWLAIFMPGVRIPVRGSGLMMPRPTAMIVMGSQHRSASHIST